MNALRYSVPWYRANPRPGEYDRAWIGRSLEYLVGKLGIVPIIDLIHYGTPLWLENGVLNHECTERIAEYASAFARQFKGLVSHYTPRNEPQISALWRVCGYRTYWPPYLVGVDGWTKVGLKVGRGMALTSQALRAEVACFLGRGWYRSALPSRRLLFQRCSARRLQHLREEWIDRLDYFGDAARAVELVPDADQSHVATVSQ